MFHSRGKVCSFLSIPGFIKVQLGNQGFPCYQVALAGRKINPLLRVNLLRDLIINKPIFSLVPRPLVPLPLKVLLYLTVSFKDFMFSDTSEASRVADTHCFLSCFSLGFGTLDLPPLCFNNILLHKLDMACRSNILLHCAAYSSWNPDRLLTAEGGFTNLLHFAQGSRLPWLGKALSDTAVGWAYQIQVHV